MKSGCDLPAAPVRYGKTPAKKDSNGSVTLVRRRQDTGDPRELQGVSAVKLDRD